MTGLELTLLYLMAAVLGVAVCRLLRLPAILGYLLVGVLIAPQTLGLAWGQDSGDIKHLAEYGVVFLMFVIGLEFNLNKLRAMRRLVFGLGLCQVLLTMALGSAGLLVLAAMLPAGWGLDSVNWQGALALGGAMAMSSTAIVMKMVADRMELDSEHGRRVVGVLLFQDLAVVPLLVLIPALGSRPEQMALALLTAALKAVLLIALLLAGGRWLIRRWLTVVARWRSDELFMLNVLLFTLGLSWLTEHAGLSLALGAFIAGMLISETEFRHQVASDIKPFHDILLGLFFITIGMLLDPLQVWAHWPLVLFLLAVPVLLKLALVGLLARLFGAAPGVALRTGLYLAQAGEFGFVLLTLAQHHALLASELFNPVLAAMVLSMLATPFIIMSSNALVSRLAGSDWLLQSLHMTQLASETIGLSEHVIICGYGRAGQATARMLHQEGIKTMALDTNPDLVRQAAAAGERVAYGDAARLQSLRAAGMVRARALVITYIDLNSTLKVLTLARQHAPRLPIVVRTQGERDLERLRLAGATEVVPEAVEGALMLAGHALVLMGVPMRRVVRRLQAQRAARYSLLRGGYFKPEDEAQGDDPTEEARLASVTLPEASPLAGQSIANLPLAALGVSVVRLRRANGAFVAPEPGSRVAAGDMLVLSGSAQALANAEQALLRP